MICFKYAIIITFCLFQWLQLKSQDTTIFAPLGATWYYTPYHFGSPEFWLFTFVAEKDTLMNGYEAREIACYIYDDGEYHRREDLFKYVATIGNKVYYRVGDEFVLLYDFGAQAGDTIHSAVEEFEIFMGCGDFPEEIIEFSYVIDSVAFVEYDGVILRQQFVRPGTQHDWGFAFWQPVVEHIGYSNHGGYWWGQGEGCILEANGYLRCYTDNDISYRNPYYNENYECGYTAVSEISNQSFYLFPNPALDYIHLTIPLDHIHIYSSTGELLDFKTETNRIDVSGWSPGIYFLTGNANGRAYCQKFLKG